jgi:hypothetical protein
MQKPQYLALIPGLWLASLSLCAQGIADRPTAPRGGADPKALSAAAAANDASSYLAQLRRCEGVAPQRRAACVEAAKR